MPDKRINRFKQFVPVSSMHGAPDKNTQCINEVLFGEYVQETNTTDDTDTEWVHVEASRDGYTGFMLKQHLTKIDENSSEITHWVAARSTLVFTQAAIKSRVVHHLPFRAHVTVSDVSCLPFYQLDSGDYIWAQHLQEIKTPMNCDPVSLAKKHFLGAPYLWGGCTPQGLDCSGLVQAIANALGYNIPRDSGDQEQALVNDISHKESKAGDLVYWPGHTGILASPDSLLHATSHSLSCVIEPLNDVVERAGPVSSIKRLFS